MDIPTAEATTDIKAASKGKFKNLTLYRIPKYDGLYRLESHAGRLLLPMDHGNVMALTAGKATKEGVPTQAVSIFSKWLDVEPRVIDLEVAFPTDGTPNDEEKAPF